jgi:hypothetical protein
LGIIAPIPLVAIADRPTFSSFRKVDGHRMQFSQFYNVLEARWCEKRHTKASRVFDSIGVIICVGFSVRIEYLRRLIPKCAFAIIPS